MFREQIVNELNQYVNNEKNKLKMYYNAYGEMIDILDDKGYLLESACLNWLSKECRIIKETNNKFSNIFTKYGYLTTKGE